jgi:hypothetical protein
MAVLACVLILTVFPVSAEEESLRGDGLSVSLEMGVDALNMAFRTFEHSEYRVVRGQNHSEIQYLISNWEFAKDARATIAYNAANYGGSFAFQPQIVSGSWTFGALMRGFFQFSFLRLTLGNDIETNYADWQGSDEGLLFNNGNGWHNPDNITDSSGLLAEAVFNSFTFAVSAGDFSSRWMPTSRIFNGPKFDNIFLDRYNVD